MGNDGNGKFLRGLFWTLLLGSFAWGTTVLVINSTALTGHCRDAEAKQVELKNEMIRRDELMLKEIVAEFKEINNVLSEQRSDLKWIKEKIRTNGK